MLLIPIAFTISHPQGPSRTLGPTGYKSDHPPRRNTGTIHIKPLISTNRLYLFCLMILVVSYVYCISKFVTWARVINWMNGTTEKAKRQTRIKTEEEWGIVLCQCHGEDRSICIVQGGPIKSKQLQNYQ